ncbi:MAG: hypothetical protein V1858_04885 [Candidatus Gottesmanbacteria bacterium]
MDQETLKKQFVVEPGIEEKMNGLTLEECQGDQILEEVWRRTGLITVQRDPRQINETSAKFSEAFVSALRTCPVFDENGPVKVGEEKIYYSSWQNDFIHPGRKVPVITQVEYNIKPLVPEIDFETYREFCSLVRTNLGRGI